MRPPAADAGGVAIGDCHGQELNRRNLHDPALSPAQVLTRLKYRRSAPPRSLGHQI
jgi:hypothetical protein